MLSGNNWPTCLIYVLYKKRLVRLLDKLSGGCGVREIDLSLPTHALCMLGQTNGRTDGPVDKSAAIIITRIIDLTAAESTAKS